MKQHFLSLAAIVLLLIGSFQSSTGQSIYFNYTDGVSTTYALQDVRKIDFSGDMMNLHLFDGTVYSWNISAVNFYEYQPEAPIIVEEWLGKANDSQVKVFPNPGNGEQTIALAIAKEQRMLLQLLDANGQLVMERQLGILSKGEHSFPLAFNGAAGQYTLVLRNDHFSVSKKIIRTL
jgi:hypothetical protein